jgi:hypothetical protein
MGWVVNATPSAALPRERDLIPNVHKAWWVPGPVWTGAENLSFPPQGFDARTFQTLASLCTDYSLFFPP